MPASILDQTTKDDQLVVKKKNKTGKKDKKVEKKKKTGTAASTLETKTNGPSPQRFRPPQSFLDVFWLLSDGETESQRNKGAVQLFESITKAEAEQRDLLLKYSKDRLIRGLSSGRKFARVGFSVALTLLLRNMDALTTADILQTIKKKLQFTEDTSYSKAEVGGIYLGKAYAYSALMQSGRLLQLSEEELLEVVDDVLFISDKKSYMKPVCNNLLESLAEQISVEVFTEHLWAKLRDRLKEGWEGCTLDKLSLLVVCRDRFPDVVTKKFLKKHWGYPLFSQDNDEKLMKAVLVTKAQKSETSLQKFIPSLMKNGRTALSVWQGLGEPMMNKATGKKSGLQLARDLLRNTTDKEQILEMMQCSSLAPVVFHSTTAKDDLIAKEANSLFEEFSGRVATCGVSVRSLAVQLWAQSSDVMEANKAAGSAGVPGDIISSHNFTHLIQLMEKSEAAEYIDQLIDALKGKKDSIQLSSDATFKGRQVDCILRCLHTAATTQRVTSLPLQKAVLPLFLRLAFFRVDKKVSSIQHCETTKINLEHGDANQKLCQAYLFKSLTQLSTMSCGGSGSARSKVSGSDSNLETFVQLLSHLAEYFESLLKCAKLSPLTPWAEGLVDEWEKVFSLLPQLKKNKSGEKSSASDFAFSILFLFLSLNMLSDFKTASDLLQEVHACYIKAKTADGESDVAWQEVVTEVLLNLMSLPSHLGRVVASQVFRMLVPHLTTGAVLLITEILLPKKRGDDAGGVLVEADKEASGDEDEDEEDDVDDDKDDAEDIADKDVVEKLKIDENLAEKSDSSDDDSDEDDSDEDEEEEEEDMDVDEKFRASVKQALGDASVPVEDDGKEDDEDEELSDLSDTEMFKLDDMLAEVFRQKKKAKVESGRKSREEKQREMNNFRIKVMDLVEVLVKCDRCGDFALDLLRPLILMLFKTDPQANMELYSKVKHLFNSLKVKAKGQADGVHSAQERRDTLAELLDLAQTVSKPTHLQEVSSAFHMVMGLKYEEEEDDSQSDGVSHGTGLVAEAVKSCVTKGKSLLFFSSLIDNDASHYHSMVPALVSYLRDSDVKLEGKASCCAMLAGLIKRSPKNVDKACKTAECVQDVASIMSQFIKNFKLDTFKVIFAKEVVNLAVILQNRKDFGQMPFSRAEVEVLDSLKPKLKSDDLRRLVKRFTQDVNQKEKKGKKEKKNKKQKISNIQENGHSSNDQELEASKSKSKKHKRKKELDVSVEERPSKKKKKQ